MKKENKKSNVIMDKNQNSRFYISGDSSHVDSFIQIPKALFTDERYSGLPIRCKVAYSIYLSRYTATTYHDDVGPYIIFADRDMAQFIDTTPAYVKTLRRRLKEAGLIDYRRSVSYNRIYLYSYSHVQNEDNMFFYENTLDSWRFYRFPRRLLEPEFINLGLDVKFIYSMYFDMMCLSQANFFSDSLERIYFQQSADDQVLRSGFSKPTLRKCRDMLKACHLLSEYHPFSQSIRFYLLKLDQFEDNVFKFENMTPDEKATYIKLLDRNFADQFAVHHELPDYRKRLKEKKITVAQAAERFMEETGKSLSVGGLRKYLNGTRQMPDDVKDSIERLLKGDPALCNKSDEHNTEKDISSLKEKKQTFYSKDDEDSDDFITFISDTDSKYTEENKTEDRYTNKIKEEEKEKKKENHTALITFISGTEFPLSERDRMFLSSVDAYIFKNKDSNEFNAFYSEINELYVIAVLNAMASVSFRSPLAEIKYFIKAYTDRYTNEYSWFGLSEKTERERYISRCYPKKNDKFSDEVKNFKLFS